MPSFNLVSQLWDRLRTSLWFIPGLISVFSVFLAFLSMGIDRRLPTNWLAHIPLIFTGEAAGARAVLSTIATSTISIAGVIFSMTIVSLQLASSQFGPRLLRSFLRDRGSQVVLGTFVGTFLYCIVVLPSIDPGEQSNFVPQVSVTFSILLAVLSLAMFVYFIDHVGHSIHADAVVSEVSRELDETIDYLFPKNKKQGEVERKPPSQDSSPTSIYRSEVGYIRYIDNDSLVKTACENDCYIELKVVPGEFILQKQILASVWPSKQASKEVRQKIASAFSLGSHRTPLQDLDFAFEQLTEMAVRALSPSINDPYTALHCIRRISSGMIELVARPRPERHHLDKNGVERLIAKEFNFQNSLHQALDPITVTAGAHLVIWTQLLETLRAVHDQCFRNEDKNACLHQAQLIREKALSKFTFRTEAAREMGR